MFTRGRVSVAESRNVSTSKNAEKPASYYIYTRQKRYRFLHQLVDTHIYIVRATSFMQ